METIDQKLSLNPANDHLATNLAILVTAVDGDRHSFLVCIPSLLCAGPLLEGQLGMLTWEGLQESSPLPHRPLLG